jgi:hypothetical protein
MQNQGQKKGECVRHRLTGFGLMRLRAAVNYVPAERRVQQVRDLYRPLFPSRHLADPIARSKALASLSWKAGCHPTFNEFASMWKLPRITKGFGNEGRIGM